MIHMKNQISALNDSLPILGEKVGKRFGLKRSWPKPLLMTLSLLLAILITVYVSYKEIVSCILCCISPTPTKIMISKQLETTDYI